MIAEKADGEVTSSASSTRPRRRRRPARECPGGKPVAEPKLEKGKEYVVAPAKDVRPVPAYSRCRQLAAAITIGRQPGVRPHGGQPLWALMMGRGLVHPLDLDHSANPPSHPELLDLLADEFAAHKFDVKWLLREIALSKTYQRSSELPAGGEGPGAPTGSRSRRSSRCRRSSWPTP